LTCRPPRLRIGPLARQREGVQRRRHQRQQGGIDQIGAAPAMGVEQHAGGGPARGRGEPADEGEHRDRPPRGRAENAAERGEGGVIERGRHGDADHDPGGEIGNPVRGEHQRDEAGCPCQ